MRREAGRKGSTAERRAIGAAELIAEYHAGARALWRAVAIVHAAEHRGAVRLWDCAAEPCRGACGRILRWRRLAGELRAGARRRELTWRVDR